MSCIQIKMGNKIKSEAFYLVIFKIKDGVQIFIGVISDFDRMNVILLKVSSLRNIVNVYIISIFNSCMNITKRFV